MKTLRGLWVIWFLVLALFIIAAGVASAEGPVVGPEDQLCWTANAEADLAGYGLHFATTSQAGGSTKSYPAFKDVLLTSTPSAPCYRIGDLALTEGQKYAAATAVDTAKNRSGFSNEVAFIFDKTAPANPGGMKIIINIPNPTGASVSIQSGQ